MPTSGPFAVVLALLTAIPGMGAIIDLLMLLFYVGAVIATGIAAKPAAS